MGCGWRCGGTCSGRPSSICGYDAILVAESAAISGRWQSLTRRRSLSVCVATDNDQVHRRLSSRSPTSADRLIMIYDGIWTLNPNRVNIDDARRLMDSFPFRSRRIDVSLDLYSLSGTETLLFCGQIHITLPHMVGKIAQ